MVAKQTSVIEKSDVLLGIIPEVEEAIWSAIQVTQKKLSISDFSATQLNVNMLFLLFIRQ